MLIAWSNTFDMMIGEYIRNREIKRGILTLFFSSRHFKLVVKILMFPGATESLRHEGDVDTIHV